MSKPTLFGSLALLALTAAVSAGCTPPAVAARPAAEPIDVSALPVVVSGTEQSLGPTDGDVVVLVFFTTWCPASAATMAMVEDLCARTTGSGGRHLRCVAVDEGDTSAEVGRFFDASHRRMTVARDPDATLAKQLALPAVPSIVVLDRHGVARHVQGGYHGASDWRALSSEIAALLSEEPSADVPRAFAVR